MKCVLPVNAQAGAKSRHLFFTFFAAARHDWAGAVIWI
jgi:hypothetical protein